MARKTNRETPQPDLFSALDAPGDPSGVPPRPAPPPPAPEAADARAFQHLAEVAVVGPVRSLFTYVADAVWDQLVPGARVQVPFGRRTATGFFVAGKSPDELAREGVNPARLRPILRVLDAAAPVGGAAAATQALVTPTLLALARWIARHYAAPLGSVLSAMLPSGVKKGAAGARVRVVLPAVAPEELLRKADELAARKPRQAAVLLALAATPGPQHAAALLQEAAAPDSALRALEKAGLVRVTAERPEAPCSDVDMAGEDAAGVTLTDEQAAALAQVQDALQARESNEGELRGFLLQGVTGSGKTEIYLRGLQTVLAQGRQGIVLVPEIALTPQTAQRFERRLGRERVAVLHSHVTEGERAEAWHAVREGRIDVVVGARSALFAPLPRLGVIVIDEEHETAFKQESTPRYHARDVALELARLSGAVLILGSATPSFEALYAAKTGRLRHLVLSQRVAGRPLPPVEIVDMTRENREVERYSYLSRSLLRAMAETLARGEQTILFMNRRGFATVITCLRCGYTEKCGQCDITLTSHRLGAAPHGHREILTCHYCGIAKPVPEFCGGCGAPGVKHWGVGTERVENEVRKVFPGARVARMDSDTMTRRTAYLETLGSFRAGKTDILVGTQMIAKGLDFPNVTLVGVVLADTALHMPDFRSRERTFQLLAQVAGRAGRSAKGGRVVIQTHLPQDPAIRAAVQHDYEAFSLQELQERRAYGYPPYTRLARVLIRGKDQGATRRAAHEVADALRAACPTTGVTILGPAEPPIAKLEGFHRQHILLKAGDGDALAALLAGPAGDVLAKLKGASAAVDVDPLAML
ncbi:MAG: primosomal protein N' [Planctomycetota bacterium]|nr:primosomal protein N' [Planctomycetota bacterium]